MTDQHPLTDDTCRQLANIRGRLGLAEIDFMRAAADWQWEQVFQAWEQCLESDTDIQVIRRFDHKLKAMRPEVVDLPQANSDVCGEEGMERARQRTFEENDELMRKLSDS